MNNEKIREEIITCALSALEKGLVRGTGGNFSARCDEGFIITPSGMDYKTLTPPDLPLISASGEILEGTRAPSIEKELHRLVYLRRGDVSAVAHTHSLYASAAASLRKPLPVLLDNQAVIFGGAIPVAEHAPIGTAALAENCAKALGKGSAVLMANHGALCVGETLSDAVSKCEALETFAHIFFLAGIYGGGAALSAEEAKREAKDIKERYGQK